MKIEYRTGDLLASDIPVIAHGCNTLGRMGAGVAAQIRVKYPACYQAYRDTYEKTGLKLGENFWWTGADRSVANMMIQARTGRDPGVIYCDYEAIRSCMREANGRARPDQNMKIGMPLIGAGLANGSWKTISAIIELESTNFQPVVFLFDGRMPKI